MNFSVFVPHEVCSVEPCWLLTMLLVIGKCWLLSMWLMP